MSDEPTLFEKWVKDGLSDWMFEDMSYFREDFRAFLFVLDEHLKERYGVVPR